LRRYRGNGGRDSPASVGWVMIDQLFFNQAAGVLAACRAKGLSIVTAESCTGGLVSAALTAVPGSSDVVERGFVTYSNEAKTEMLGVPADAIRTYGAVSSEVALMMAQGALERSRAHRAVAVTGIAGPGGGTAQKPVGLVYLAFSSRAELNWEAASGTVFELRFGDIGRDKIRLQTVETAQRHLTSLL